MRPTPSRREATSPVSITRFFIGSLVLLTITIMALATARADGHRPPLSTETIERVLDVLTEVRENEEYWDSLIGPHTAFTGMTGSGPGILERSLPGLQSDPRYGELDDLAQRHGYSSFAEFAPEGDQAMRAYMALKMGAEMEGANVELQESLAEIENDPSMSPEMKNLLKTQLNSYTAMMRMFEAPEADKAAMAPYLAQYDAALDMENTINGEPFGSSTAPATGSSAGAAIGGTAGATLGAAESGDASGSDDAARLEQLESLKASGLISEEIYQQKRAEILGLPEPSAEPTLEERLAKLKDLKEQGLITDEIYAQKVSEILSEL